MNIPKVIPATIANAGSLSGAAALGDGALSRIVMPAAWTAGNLTFQTSYDGTSFADLYDSTGVEYTVTAAAGRAIILNVADFIGVRFIKIRSGTGSVPVAQGADRILQLVVQP